MALKDLMNKGIISGRAAYHAALDKRSFEDVKDKTT